MKIKRAWLAKCNACNSNFKIREYEGLEGKRYSMHFCDELETRSLKGGVFPDYKFIKRIKNKDAYDEDDFLADKYRDDFKYTNNV